MVCPSPFHVLQQTKLQALLLLGKTVMYETERQQLYLYEYEVYLLNYTIKIKESEKPKWSF